MKKYKVISIILIILSFIIIGGVYLFYRQFPGTTFEQIIYHLRTSISGTATGLIMKFGSKIIIAVVGLIIVFFGYKFGLKYYRKRHHKKVIDAKKEKKIVLSIFGVSCVLFLGSIYFLYYKLGIKEYFDSYKTESLFIKENYVNPKDVKIDIPKNSNNLILIYLESIESSMASKKNGGIFNNNYIPNLTKIAEDNVSFSNNDRLGGANQIWGSGWSTAGYLSTTGGIVMKIPLAGDGPNQHPSKYPKLFNLGDILEDKYNEELMIGSESTFGGIKEYYENHGKFTIWDSNNAANEELVNDKNNNGWGLNDHDLYERSKTDILNLAKQDKPFFFNLITIDTHAEDGYVDSSCPNKFKTSYENSVYCADIMINDYITWIKEQDFYKNTTIVILGDHLSMNHSMFDSVEKNPRFAYNVIINSKINTKNSRNYSPVDYFPTIVASLGIQIEGNRLGLGTNLFSDEKTLIENYGLDYVNDELSKKSSFYENELLY